MPTTYKYVHPVREFRPRRTRSKSGCFPCRLRHRKCDEQKPICHGCTQKHLICSWPATVSEDAGKVRWRLDLKAGLGVSKCAKSSTRETPSKSQRRASVIPQTTARDHISTFQQRPSIARSPTPTRRKSLNKPYTSLLLEHFVSRTGHVLVGRDASKNPFLYYVLPIAQQNEFVMHALLAVSGVHMQLWNQGVEIIKATYEHYGAVLKRLEVLLTDWVAGSREETLNLFLVTTLMCMYEAFSGDVNVSLSHHLQACREFAMSIGFGDQSQEGDDLAALLTECYVYFATICQFDASRSGSHPILNENDLVLSKLSDLRNYSAFGSILGCASQLYRLVPQILHLIAHGTSEFGRDGRKDDLYEELRFKVMNWSVSSETDQLITNRPLCETLEQTSGLIVQNTLFLLIYSSHLSQRWSPQITLSKIQPLIDHNMSLFEIVGDNPVMHVIFWAYLITGSMIRNGEQREHLSRRLRTHHTRIALGHRVMMILQWLWDDPDESTFGLPGLQKVAREQGVSLCVA